MNPGCGLLKGNQPVGYVLCSGVTPFLIRCQLSLRINSGQMVRDYVILCHGWVPPETSRITAPLFWAEQTRLPTEVRHYGKPATTKVKVGGYLVLFFLLRVPPLLVGFKGQLKEQPTLFFLLGGVQ